MFKFFKKLDRCRLIVFCYGNQGVVTTGFNAKKIGREYSVKRVNKIMHNGFK